MKRSRLSIVLPMLVVGIGALYLGRGFIRDAVELSARPDLPDASAYRPSPQKATGASGQDTSAIEGGYATSQNYILESSPPAKKPPQDPLAFTGTLPAEVNLDVPFTSQAPHANWDLPYQETCEEASALMVDAFYDGRTGVIPVNEADAALKKLVAWQEATFGYYEDTTAAETARILKEYYGYANVLVRPIATVDDIKRPLARGLPVIVPAAGKLLGNPNFRNGGPDYHMLVIRGYTPTLFITNDPGTRKGREYTYSYDTIMNAAHDWTGSKSTVTTGKRVMIIVVPNP